MLSHSSSPGEGGSYAQGHKIRDLGLQPYSKVFFFSFFSKISFDYSTPPLTEWEEKQNDSVKPLLMTGGKTPLKISHFEDSPLKKIITNETYCPSQSQLQFFASHWSSKQETQARS